MALESGTRRQGEKSAVLAAVLSFFIPGLGEIYAGRVLRGLIIAIPQTVVLVILAVLYLQHGAGFVAGTITFQYPFAALIVNVALLFVRAFSVIDAYLIARRASGPPKRTGAAVALGVIALSVMLVGDVYAHGTQANTYWHAYQVASQIFGSCDDVDPNDPLPPRGCETPAPSGTDIAVIPTPTVTPTGSVGVTEPGATPTLPSTPGLTDSPAPSITPIPPGTPYWAEDGRLDILIVGSDAGLGRVGSRPDATHVASIDLATGRSALFSLPRYLSFPPLPPETAGLWPCGCFRGYTTGYLNAIYTWATENPNDFPGGANRGYRALQGTVETLLGIHIDGIVVVNLQGFVQAVDALGGITMFVPESVYDEHYVNERDQVELVNIDAGWHHFDGHEALKYVRSRHQDGDIQRLSRQQNFLRALRSQISYCGINLYPRLPGLLDALKEIVETDIPLSEVPAMIEVLQNSKKPRRVEFTSDNGFSRNMLDPGMKELYLGAARTGFDARPGDDIDTPDPSPPPRFEPSC
ncbi:MAG: LCP family protein [Candidatus Limnocylindrales bacterium]